MAITGNLTNIIFGVLKVKQDFNNSPGLVQLSRKTRLDNHHSNFPIYKVLPPELNVLQKSIIVTLTRALDFL